MGVSQHNQILDTDLVLSSLTKIPMRMRIVAPILSFVFAAAAAGAEGNLSHPPPPFSFRHQRRHRQRRRQGGARGGRRVDQ